MNKMARPGNPYDRQHLRTRVNQTKKRRNGKILLTTLGCVALVTLLTAQFTLAQSDSDSTVPPGDAEAIEATVQVLPLSSPTVLDALSDAVRAEVERICLPVQYQTGAVAYRECIREQLDSQSSPSTLALPSTSLSFDEEFAIQQTCQGEGPVDSVAYRACDEKQLASLAGVPEPALEKITEDEVYAVQLDCYDIQTNNGVKAYRECLNESIRQLLALPRPDLSKLTLVDKNALQLRCSAQNISAVAYRNCLLNAVDRKTVANPAVEPFTEAPVLLNDIEPSAEPSGQNASPAEIIVSTGVADTAEESQPAVFAESESAVIATSIAETTPKIETTPVVETTSIAETTPKIETTPVVETTSIAETTPKIETTQLVESDPAVTRETAQVPTQEPGNQDNSNDDIATQSETPAQTDDTEKTAADLLTRWRNNFASMSNMTRMLIWAAIALPLLLTLMWLLLRGRKTVEKPLDTYPEYPNNSGIDTAPHRPSSTRRVTADETAEFATKAPVSSRQDESSTTVTNDDTLEFSAQMDELFGTTSSVGTGLVTDTEKNPDTAANSALRANPAEEPEPTPEPDLTLDEEPEPEPDLTLDSESDLHAETAPIPESPPPTEFTLTPATERDDYLAWLSVQDEARQQTLAIEFLIYWMAYSDERYPPELKKKILRLQNPGDHELIKRWTLNNDVHAFAGNLQWVQYNLNSEQHEQIINLLMALLVSENALTPAQNTLLRFLADAFGLGAKRLDELFQTGFAHAMPQLPRLDDPGWWKSQSADTLKRWDARSVSKQRSEIRYRVALGLPLEGELEPESIMSSFRRAAKRCQPERFNRLSSRERNLVAKQLEKYEKAAESLLEVSA